ncbi:hypothetical protein JCM10212_006218 [Sporobolomyces blumeae]
MPAPQTNFVASTDKGGYDPATLSDDEDVGSDTSRSTWASTSDATILGFADGFVGEGGKELSDWRVSRVGGLPPMPLLTQIYCPLESSSLERVTYVFACPRAACRKREGSIRAFRANRVWTEAPEEKAKVEEEKREKQPKPVAVDLGGLVFGGSASVGSASNPSSNPFAPTTASTSSNPFAPRPVVPVTNPFSPPVASPLNPFAPSPTTPAADVADSTTSTDTRHDGQVTSSWTSGPAYPPQYITTSYEPASPQPSTKNLPPMSNLKISDPLSDEPDLSDDESPVGGGTGPRAGKGSGGRTKKGSGGGHGRADGSGGRGGGGGGAGKNGVVGEGYEVQRVKGVDEIFLRFQERVAREGTQVVRYDHGTQPLPFSASSAAYRTLYPPSTPGGPVSSHPPSTSSSSATELGQYTPSRAPTCRACRQRSTFEYQLMPHLVSVLNKTEGLNGLSAYDDASGGDCRRPAANDARKAKADPDDEGLDWATVWVYSCERECVDPGKDKEAWREERVLVEWEE